MLKIWPSWKCMQWIHYVVNVETENQTIPPTVISTTDVPTAVKTSILYQIMPSLKKERNLNYKTHEKHTLSRSPKNSWRLHKKTKPIPNLQNNPKLESKKGENYQELISKLLQLGSQEWPKFIQEIKPILLKLSSNCTNPKPITEHNLEKTSKYIETNPSKQPPREEIRAISPHKNPYKKPTKPQKTWVNNLL